MNFEFMGTKVCKGCFPLSTSTKVEIIYEPSQREESTKPPQANSVAQVILRITVYSHSITV